MKQIHLNIILIVGIIICGWLSLRDEETPTQVQQVDYDYYKQRFIEVEQRIDSVWKQVNFKDTLIHENSILIHNAPRSKRDSIRAIVNPR